MGRGARLIWAGEGHKQIIRIHDLYLPFQSNTAIYNQNTRVNTTLDLL